LASVVIIANITQDQINCQSHKIFSYM